MSEGFTLICPIRGTLKASRKSKDGLTPSEEFRRVEALRHLISLGYPKANFVIEAVVKRFGNAGRNSMRADLAVLDVPAATIDTSDVDTLLDHAVVLGEIKRDSAKADYVKATQVKPLLDFAKHQDCNALYWDNVEQRTFWTTINNKKRVVNEGPLALFPRYGQAVNVTPLLHKQLVVPDSLLDVFDRIENILHQAAIDLEKRYETILKLLLSKIFDEHKSAAKPARALEYQDFESIGVSATVAADRLNALLSDAVTYYEKHLPKAVSKTFALKSTVLVDCAKIIAPILITAAKRDVIQTFYMKFAKDLYRWDLAQFFTPTTVTDFIVEALNPQFGEHIKDPACGSADFLVAAFHRGRVADKNYAECIWGADNSENAVQAAVLNMLLNGDGKTNIRHEDSLESVEKYKNKYQIMVCNPPFGVRIVEKRPAVLSKFDLGRVWQDLLPPQAQVTDAVLTSQETGLLFAELCVRQVEAGGRIAIILPNGYLGNRSSTYVIFREWLLRNCKLASICSFPRFTFKTSGADVSASVVFLEKREVPLKSSSDDKDYAFHVGLIENVGWNVGDKAAAPVYCRDPEDGSFIVDEEGDRILESDFGRILEDFRTSVVAEEMGWVTEGTSSAGKAQKGWAVPIATVLADPERTFDPKRYSKKYMSLVRSIAKGAHFKLTDVMTVIPESTRPDGTKVKKSASELYHYVEIQDMGFGEYQASELRGWELPSRAKHFGQPGDLYLGSIWGSVSKWFLVDNNAKSLVVTNGCYRLRLKKGSEGKLADLVAFLCTDAYSTQMRALARGSDGLAEIHETDLSKVLIPTITDAAVRKQIQGYVDALLAGKSSLHGAIGVMMKDNQLPYPTPTRRPHHAVLV